MGFKLISKNNYLNFTVDGWKIKKMRKCVQGYTVKNWKNEVKRDMISTFRTRGWMNSAI